MKNWNEIAKVGNEQLRMSLISAKGEIEEGLKRGFPQYFLSEGETHPKPNRNDLIQLMLDINRRDDTIQACKDAGLPFQRFSFSGSKKGDVDGVSYAQGGYNTVRYGWAEYFWRSTSKRGDTLEYKGTEWLVVWNGYSAGDAESFSVHTLVIVPVDALS